MSNRRSFLKRSAFASISIIGLRAFGVDELPKDERTRLTILHTNDMHSHVDPFPEDHSRYPGLGGMAQRASFINEARRSDPDLVLLDAGDVFQGTPYFNFFGGSLELELMSKMGYDASTIGNHEFDGGMENFVKAQQKANFPFINANYDFGNTPMAGSTIAHKVITRKGIRIGIFGVGVQLAGLVDPRLYGETIYLDPIKIAQQQTDILREELSHLGYQYDEADIVCDTQLAKASSNIDLIIGGHTHTFLNTPLEVKKKKENSTFINQVGWAGVHMGAIHFDMHLDGQILQGLGGMTNIIKGHS